MKKTFTIIALMLSLALQAKTIPFGKGNLTVRTLSRHAVRIIYSEGQAANDLPDWVYVKNDEATSDLMEVATDASKGSVTIKDKTGKVVFTATRHQLDNQAATLTIASPADEYLYGLGQFQDGYSNIRGLSRRLTQVNTQISIPMMLSSKGYGLLWNNYGLTEFNPGDLRLPLTALSGSETSETVDVTSTEGGKKEVRRRNRFGTTLDIAETGDYAFLLDVGQKMARRHHLTIDGQTVIDMQNVWLPPTASQIVHLEAGRHQIEAELSNGDNPVVYIGKVSETTTFRTPQSPTVDYTVFIGTPDEIIADYRALTGQAPMMPRWALGYIHCRERFHSQAEILSTAKKFRSEQLPVDMLVQDWQYWGKYGWNSMQFDEEHYPSPKALTDELHKMDIKLMLSVWSKIDKRSEVGRQMEAAGNYIPSTDWIDFFNPSAAAAYWKNFKQRLVPLGIDAWWQDATEPENDDLAGRRVNQGKWSGEEVRNVYPLLVNKTVYEGLRQCTTTDASGQQVHRRPLILTRCGFSGIQRYGAALWSGDVGNDWETLRRQLTAGLGLQAAGIPWWTYDAGGFFRPGNQYQDKAYIERMLRWIEASVYLPLMRVHGYMSNTEPWNYGTEAQEVIRRCLNERYRLLPYIYSNAAAVSAEGSTLMRPLIFDFANDTEALQQKHEYMFGKTLLVCPVTASSPQKWNVYLPVNQGGWYDYRNQRHYEGGQHADVPVDGASIPVFARGGSILVTGQPAQSTLAQRIDTLTITVYPGADATFTLYEDEGSNTDYEQGQWSRIRLDWNDKSQRLTIQKREGQYAGMPLRRHFIVNVVGSQQKTVAYKGRRLTVR